jgi:hypothetical protein
VSTSLLGDQFALIATPWLVLQLTGDPLALGIVLALEGVPRALFMLFGGAVTDRFSPRVIMLVADIARLVLAACRHRPRPKGHGATACERRRPPLHRYPGSCHALPTRACAQNRVLCEAQQRLSAENEDVCQQHY